MNSICFFHRADFDGVCSAAIVKKFVPDCELRGIDYGDEFPWCKVDPTGSGGLAAKALRRAVYLVDFSLPPADMKRLAEVCDLVWIDHHKSAIEACAGLPHLRGIRFSGLAGCELTWGWFVSYKVVREGDAAELRKLLELGLPATGVPEAVHLLGRYDVWDAENPEWARIEAFQFGLRAIPGIMDPEHIAWSAIVAVPGYPLSDGTVRMVVDSAVDRGQAILSYRDQEAKAACADGCHEETIYTKDFVPVRADGGAIHPHRLVCLNTLQRGSWLFKGVWDPEKHDAMCVYGRLKDGRWRVSLYSTKPEVDCGAIAQSFGGGGHRGAGGFLAEELPWRI